MLSPREAVVVEFEVDNVDEAGGIMFSGPALHQLHAKVPSSEETSETLPVSSSLSSLSSPGSREKWMHLCAQKLVRALLSCSMEHFTW